MDIGDTTSLPLIPLRGIVLFPGMKLHLDIGRKKSKLAIEASIKNEQKILFVTQKDIEDYEPEIGKMYSIGTVAKVLQVISQPDDTLRVLVEGMQRIRLEGMYVQDEYIIGEAVILDDIQNENENEQYAVQKLVKGLFKQYARLFKNLPEDLLINIEELKQSSQLSDYISSNIYLDWDEKQELLDEINIYNRFEKLASILLREIDLLKISNDISKKLKSRIEKNQREYYLREQVKLLYEELGESDDPHLESEEFKNQILNLHLEDENEIKLLKEANKLSKMPAGSHEANVIRGYLETCLSLPWNVTTKDNIDLCKAKKVLDKEHYGMERVKERILELFAIRNLSPDIKGQIICLVGPPGVGKTSIAKSIAKALNRKYVRISLGGIKDESDVRGHRRTYVGAMPGRIISAIKQAGSKNPLVLLDEIDKLGKDFNGDPASALLEVLDAEQNNSFYDHYIDLPFDLSNVLFITTANEYNSIPEPLLDRMDVINLSSYTHNEKFNIAKKHLIPKQLKNNGMNSSMLKISDNALNDIISDYTRESGVRTLERKLTSIIRKSAKELVSNEINSVRVNEKNLKKFLGAPKFKREKINKSDQIGVARGLAWTSVGGETMPIEVALMKGKGKLELTGSLGEVMKESVKIAISCIRSYAKELGIEPEFYSKWDMHIHVPEGAIPKDGPSAGITILTAIFSALKMVPVRRDVAMTGEITLKGNVLPIGGLKEKVMAAYRAGMKLVIIPIDNEPDIEEIDREVMDNIEIKTVSNFKEVLDIALAEVLKV